MDVLKFLKFLARWEYFNPRSFWAFIFIGYFGFTTLFNNLPSFSKNPSQAQVVIEKNTASVLAINSGGVKTEIW